MRRALSIILSSLLVVDGLILARKTRTIPITLQSVYTGKLTVAAGECLTYAAVLSLVNLTLVLVKTGQDRRSRKLELRILILCFAVFACTFVASDEYVSRQLKTAPQPDQSR